MTTRPQYALDELAAAGSIKNTWLTGRANHGGVTPVIGLTRDGRALVGLYEDTSEGRPEGNRLVVKVDTEGALKLAAALAETGGRRTWFARWLLLRAAERSRRRRRHAQPSSV